MSALNENSTWKKPEVPRGKHHNQTETKTTVSLYLSKKVVKEARKHKLNLSRITEQALLSILDYLEAPNSTESSKFLSTGSFLKESVMPRWLSLVEQRFRKPSVAGSKPARGSSRNNNFRNSIFIVHSVGLPDNLQCQHMLLRDMVSSLRKFSSHSVAQISHLSEGVPLDHPK